MDFFNSQMWNKVINRGRKRKVRGLVCRGYAKNLMRLGAFGLIEDRKENFIIQVLTIFQNTVCDIFSCNSSSILCPHVCLSICLLVCLLSISQQRVSRKVIICYNLHQKVYRSLIKY